MSLFDHGVEQTIMDVLTDKDERVALQQRLHAVNPQQTLIVVKLNIPGPIKNNAELKQVFEAGIQRFLLSLDDYTVPDKWDKPVGNTWFILTPQGAETVKRWAVQFEDQDAMGRFFDVDVLTDKALSRSALGMPVRQCFICGRPAKECARSRRHSVTELQAFIENKVEANVHD